MLELKERPVIELGGRNMLLHELIEDEFKTFTIEEHVCPSCFKSAVLCLVQDPKISYNFIFNLLVA